jgi:hypothetical protein
MSFYTASVVNGLGPDFGAQPLFIQLQTTQTEPLGLRICEPDDTLSTVSFDPYRSKSGLHCVARCLEKIDIVSHALAVLKKA